MALEAQADSKGKLIAATGSDIKVNTEFTLPSPEEQRIEDFREFTDPFSFEKAEDGKWIVFKDSSRKETVTQQPTEILESILIRQFMEDTSGQNRISIPGLYLSRFAESVDDFMDLAKVAASRLGVRVEDLDLSDLQKKLDNAQTRRDTISVKGIRELVETGESWYDESYKQARLKSLAGDSSVAFFRLSILKDALSGDITQYAPAGEADGILNPYTSGLYKRQDELRGQREEVIMGINNKFEMIQKLRSEANQIEASLRV